MPRLHSCLTLVIAITLGWSPAPQDRAPVRIEVDLKEDFSDAGADFIRYSTQNTYSVFDRDPEALQGYKLPKGLKRTALLKFYPYASNDTGPPLEALMAKEPSGSQYRLWIDWNHDQRFNDAERSGVAPHLLDGYLVFPNVHHPDFSDPFTLAVHNDKHIHCVPGPFRTGDVDLAGRKVSIALIDSNRDGECKEFHGPKTNTDEPDTIVIDFDGDGSFVPRQEQDDLSFSHEQFRLSSIIQMPNGEPYKVSMSPDGHTLYLDRLPSGVIDLGQEHAMLMTLIAGGIFEARTVNGHLRFPAGSYRNEYIVAESRSSKGSIYLRTQQMRKFTLIAGEVLRFPFAESYRVDLSAKRQTDWSGSKGRVFGVDLTLLDVEGQRVDKFSLRGGGELPPPSLTVIDARGKRVYAGKFHYG